MMQKDRLYKLINKNNKQNLPYQNQYLRQFIGSPQKKKIDYNSFMIENKRHRKVQQSRLETTQNYTSFASPKFKSNIRPQSSYMCEFLAKQNQYLVNQLMIQKQKQRQYKQKIHKLKRVKSQQSLISQKTPKYISINDNQQHSMPSRVSSKNFMNSISTIKTLPEQQQTLQTLLKDSEDYLKHTKQSISNELQIMNAKLCKLLEEASSESSYEAKQKKRRQMFECVKQIRELKQQFAQHFSKE